MPCSLSHAELLLVDHSEKHGVHVLTLLSSFSLHSLLKLWKCCVVLRAKYAAAWTRGWCGVGWGWGGVVGGR